jgi:hypothetical protein
VTPLPPLSASHGNWNNGFLIEINSQGRKDKIPSSDNVVQQISQKWKQVKNAPD